ncbi:hypothetical protein EDD86DRAFT_247512 [Gorgonomyces haynaldii]|nr:hypothetical protein EDD86DRAFT_247512 [Gorgonomyces haynaldii]
MEVPGRVSTVIQVVTVTVTQSAILSQVTSLTSALPSAVPQTFQTERPSSTIAGPTPSQTITGFENANSKPDPVNYVLFIPVLIGSLIVVGGLVAFFFWRDRPRDVNK